MRDLPLIKCATLWSKIKNIKVDPRFFDPTAPNPDPEEAAKLTKLEDAQKREQHILTSLAGPRSSNKYDTIAHRYAAAPDFIYDNPLMRKSREEHTIPLAIAALGGKALFGKSLAPTMRPILRSSLARAGMPEQDIAKRLNFKDYISHSIGRRYDPHGIN